MRTSKKKVVKYRRPIHFNIGLVIFLFLFIYIMIISITFLNKNHLSICEVLEESIADDNIFQAVILRKETIVNTDKAGYINYYVGDRSRIAKNTTIYTVDESGEIYKILSNSESKNTLSQEDIAKVRGNIASFKKNYSDSYYQQVRTYKYDIENTVLELTNVNMVSNLNNILKEAGTSKSFNVVKSKMSGTISYSIDGMENLKSDQITAETFQKKEYTRQQLRESSGPIEANSPVYKVITDENWSAILLLNEEQYKKLYEKEQKQLKAGYQSGNIMVTFTKDNFTTTAKFKPYKKENDFFTKLEFDKYLIHYIDDRFVEIELSLNAAHGLKIPVTSILEKEFYTVPLDFFTTQEESSAKGLIKETYSKNGDMKPEFIVAEIFAEDEKYAYVDTSLFALNDWIYNEKTKERYQISAVKKLQGVYNVNKGYCVFRGIEKIYENKEYCIIKEDTPYGLSNYDHIIVDAANAVEEDITS